MRSHLVTRSPDEIFGALADPTRRAVLDLLRGGDRAAGEIAARFPISRPAISKHLRQLRRAGLVAETRSGRHRFYRLNPEPLRVADKWIDSYRSFWHNNLANLKAYLESTTEPAAEAAPKPPSHRRGDKR